MSYGVIVLTATTSKLKGQVTRTFGVARVVHDKQAGNTRTREKPACGVPTHDRDGRRNEWAVHTRVKGRPVMSVERARTASEARGMARRRLGKDRMPVGTTVERVV